MLVCRCCHWPAVQSSLIVCELLALDKLVASIGAIALWPYRMGACSHKQVINMFCMILGHANKIHCFSAPAWQNSFPVAYFFITWRHVITSFHSGLMHFPVLNMLGHTNKIHPAWLKSFRMTKKLPAWLKISSMNKKLPAWLKSFKHE